MTVARQEIDMLIEARVTGITLWRCASPAVSPARPWGGARVRSMEIECDCDCQGVSQLEPVVTHSSCSARIPHKRSRRVLSLIVLFCVIASSTFIILMILFERVWNMFAVTVHNSSSRKR